MNSTKPNVCSVLTPSGRGAVAVVWLSGPDAEGIINDRFQPSAGRAFRLINRDIVYGIWEPSGEDLVVCRHGETEFEIHCHGGTLASSQVVNSLVTANVEVVDHSNFLNRFGQHPWEVGVRVALSNATTTRTTEHLLKQLRLLPKSIDRLVTLIENGSDSSQQPLALIDSMLAQTSFGVHLSQARTVVFCGRPNVGKSSLLNAIAGFQRAIVHDQPGTTRDVVTQLTAIDGWPVEIKDTAGIRESSGEIESLGIEKAKQEIDTADLVVAIFDSSQPWGDEDQTLFDDMNPDMVVHNKQDLEPVQDSNQRPDGIKVSALRGTNLPELIKAIAQQLVPRMPDSESAYPVTSNQVQSLKQARARLSDGDPIQAVQLLRAPST